MVDIARLKEALAPYGELVPQEGGDWDGPFPLPEAVIAFYREVGPVKLNIPAFGNDYFIPPLSDLYEYQSGYRFEDPDSEPFEDWPDEWLVVADQGADPFILDRNLGEILHAYHGEGEWDAGGVFPDILTMAATLAVVGRHTHRIEPEERGPSDEVIEDARADLAAILGCPDKAKDALSGLGWWTP